MAELICFNFASRSRPEKFFACLENIRAMVNNKAAYYVFAKIDVDQVEMYDGHRIKSEYPEVITLYWNPRDKVEAINNGLRIQSFDILCNHSDDMWFIKKGFDDIIREHCKPNTFVHFPDGFTNEILCTYSIMHKTYFDLDGYVYDPSYRSLWCDNEAMAMAKKRGAYKYVDEHILEHRHPAWGFGKQDALYQHTERFYNIDKKTFDRRKRLLKF